MAETIMKMNVTLKISSFVAVCLDGKMRFAILEGIEGMENVKPILEAIIAGKEGSEDEPTS